MIKILRSVFYVFLFLLPATLFAQTANHVVISQLFGGGALLQDNPMLIM
jgi:hypothetical protein